MTTCHMQPVNNSLSVHSFNPPFLSYSPCISWHVVTYRHTDKQLIVMRCADNETSEISLWDNTRKCSLCTTATVARLGHTPLRLLLTCRPPLYPPSIAQSAHEYVVLCVCVCGARHERNNTWQTGEHVCECVCVSVCVGGYGNVLKCVASPLSLREEEEGGWRGFCTLDLTKLISRCPQHR